MIYDGIYLRATHLAYHETRGGFQGVLYSAPDVVYLRALLGVVEVGVVEVVEVEVVEV
jgi:hypothetical protein